MEKKTEKLSVLAIRVNQRQREWVKQHGTNAVRVLINQEMTKEKEKETHIKK